MASSAQRSRNLRTRVLLGTDSLHSCRPLFGLAGEYPVANHQPVAFLSRLSPELNNAYCRPGSFIAMQLIRYFGLDSSSSKRSYLDIKTFWRRFKYKIKMERTEWKIVDWEEREKDRLPSDQK